MTENVAIFDRGDPGGESAGNIVIQQVRGVEIDIASEVQHRGNIIIQAVDGSRINITRFLSNSKTYQDLTAEIAELERGVRASRERDDAPDTGQALRLGELRHVERRFRDDVARLAGVFAVLDVDSERLRRAREHFEAGRIQEADQILNADELQAEQDGLLADRDSVQRESGGADEQLRLNALEFLVKAELAALNFEDSGRIVLARGYFEASLLSAPLYENQAAFARFETDQENYERAGGLLEAALEMAPADLARIELRCRLAEIRARLGEREAAAADYETALQFYESYRASAEREFDPRLRMIGVLLRLSAVRLETGDGSAARSALDRVEKTLQEFSENEEEGAHPGEIETPRLKAELCEHLARWERSFEASDRARTYFARALKLRESQRASATGGAAEFDAESAFAATLVEQAELELNCGRPLEALEHLDRARPVLEYLFALNPLVIEGRLARLGLLRSRAFAARENFVRADRGFADTVRILERLAETNPTAFQGDRAMALFYRAEAALRAGRLATAMRAYEPAILFFEDLSAKDSRGFASLLGRALIGRLTTVVVNDPQSDPSWIQNEFENLRGRIEALYEAEPRSIAPLLARLHLIAVERLRRLPSPEFAAAEVRIAKARSILAGGMDGDNDSAVNEASAATPLSLEYLEVRAKIAASAAWLARDEGAGKQEQAELLQEALAFYRRIERSGSQSLQLEIGIIEIRLALALSEPDASARFCARMRRGLRRLQPLYDCCPAGQSFAEAALSQLYQEGFDPGAVVARMRGETRADTRRGQAPRRPGMLRRLFAGLGLIRGPRQPDFAAILTVESELPDAPPNVAPVIAPHTGLRTSSAAKSPEPAAQSPANSAANASVPTGRDTVSAPDSLRIAGLRDSSATLTQFEAAQRDIQIEDVRGAGIDITLYLSRSTEYQDLEERIDAARRAEKEESLTDLLRTRQRFREDVRRLAETFQSIVVDTERLRTARTLFHQGRFREADAVLVAESLREQQEELLLEKDRLAEREAEIQRRLEHNADEFLIKAKMTLLRLDLPERFDRAREYLEASLRAAETYNNTFEYADFLSDQRDYAPAVEYYERALKFPIGIGRRLGVLNNLAGALGAMQKLDRACAVYEQILKREEELAEDDPEILPEMAMTHCNYAIVLKNTFRNENAVRAARRAVELIQEYRRARPGRHSLTLVHAQLILAQSLKYTSDTAEAARCAKSVVSLLDREYPQSSAGNRNAESAVALNDEPSASDTSDPEDETKAQTYRAHALTELVGIAVITNDYESAFPYYKEAVAASEALYALNPGQHGYSLSVCLESAAWIAQKAGDAPGGLAMLERAVQLREELHARSPEAGTVHLARANDALGRYLVVDDPERAITCLERSVDLFEGVAKRDPEGFEPELLSILETLTELQYWQDHYADMLPRCERRLQLVDERPWAKDPVLEGWRADERLGAYYHLGLAKWSLQDPAGAIPYLKEALRVQIARRDPTPSRTATLALDLARAQFASGDPQAAEATYSETRPQWKKAPLSPELVEREVVVLTGLARAFYASGGRMADIERVTERKRHLYAGARRQKLSMDYRPAESNTLLDLAGIYLRTGQPGSAKTCFREARQLAEELYEEDPEAHAFVLMDCLYNTALADESGNIAGQSKIVSLTQALSLLEKHESNMGLNESQPLRLEVAAGVYSQLGQALLKQSTHEQTIERMQRAIQYRRVLARNGGDAARGWLAKELLFTAVSQFNQGGPGAAVEYTKEAVAILAEVAPENEEYRRSLELGQTMLGQVGVDPQEYLDSLK